jgi:hypothetical protein
MKCGGDENTICSRDIVGLRNSFCFCLSLHRWSTRPTAETNTVDARCRSRLRIQYLGAVVGSSHMYRRLFRERSQSAEVNV